jgi:hypothetical protein
MPAATAERPPTEDVRLVSQPDTSVLFMARRSDLRLVMKPIRTLRNREGDAVEDLPGVKIEFKDGVFRVPTDPKATVTLVDGESFEAAKILEWLEKHRLKGDWQEGFWKVDPTAPPLSRAELDTLQSLAIELDRSGLEAFIAQEEEGWAREDLLAAARGTLERVVAKLEGIGTERQRAIEKARDEGVAAGLAQAQQSKAAQQKRGTDVGRT